MNKSRNILGILILILVLLVLGYFIFTAKELGI
jgi:hypothetical protein